MRTAINDIRSSILLRQRTAIERADRIASMASEELIRSEGEHTDTADQFVIAADKLNDHMRDCISHLTWHGQAASFEHEQDGSIVVMLGDYTIGV